MATPPLPHRRAGQRLRDALTSAMGRTFILWLVLVTMFVLLWRVFQDDGASVASPELWRNLQLLPILAVAAIFGLVAWRGRSFAAANKRGVDLMASGDAAAAAELFARLARTWLAPVTVAQVNLGLARLRLADLRGAVEAFARVERGRGALARAYRPMAAAFVALCEAVLGDLGAAEEWVAEARRRTATPTVSVRVHLAAEAIVRLRRGDAVAAARLLDQTWGEIERSTSADLVRALRIVRALAGEKAGGAAAASSDELLAGARPFRAGEFAWLAAGWPEMARYLEAKGFAAVA
jgi:hypothetical protein